MPLPRFYLAGFLLALLLLVAGLWPVAEQEQTPQLTIDAAVFDTFHLNHAAHVPPLAVIEAIANPDAVRVVVVEEPAVAPPIALEQLTVTPVSAPPPSALLLSSEETTDVVIIIDDMGISAAFSEKTVALPAPLTLSYLPYAAGLPEQTRAAQARGHELMLHMPMQPMGEENPGLYALTVAMPAQAIRENLEAAFGRFKGFVAVNNHMGSRFTAHKTGMQTVMQVLQERQLAFVDSKTTGSSVALAIARQAGVPALSRDIFIDHRDDPAFIRQQLAAIEAHSRRHGVAVAIGHPRPHTIAALAQWLPGLEAKGLRLIPVSEALQQRYPAFSPKLARKQP